MGAAMSVRVCCAGGFAHGWNINKCCYWLSCVCGGVGGGFWCWLAIDGQLVAGWVHCWVLEQHAFRAAAVGLSGFWWLLLGWLFLVWFLCVCVGGCCLGTA